MLVNKVFAHVHFENRLRASRQRVEGKGPGNENGGDLGMTFHVFSVRKIKFRSYAKIQLEFSPLGKV